MLLKSEEERLAAAEKAFGIETDLLERRIANSRRSCSEFKKSRMK